MKKIFSIGATMVFALAYGIAIADEMPENRAPEPGAYYGGAVLEHEIMTKGAAPGSAREEINERSAVIWDVLFGNYESTDVPEPYRVFWVHELATNMKGGAPGGSRETGDVDESTKIFESLFGSGEGKDLP